MFRQGDLEKARGYPVSPLMDRDKEGITKSQPGVSGVHTKSQGGTFASACLCSVVVNLRHPTGLIPPTFPLLRAVCAAAVHPYRGHVTSLVLPVLS